MEKPRYALLDCIRGATLISMILYHAVWDLVYLFGVEWAWYERPIAFFWQQSICWTFILLSGFCWPLGRRQLRRGLLVLGGGVLVRLVTWIAIPAQQVRFGVLTLLGSAMLLLIPLRKLLERIPPWGGLIGSMACFFLLQDVPSGYLGSWPLRLAALPGWLYQTQWGAYFGFPPPRFQSTDYFPLIPWLFLFLAGFFLHRALLRNGRALPNTRGLAPLNAIGRHSLIIYLLHQPAVYILLSCWFYFAGR
ncbi:MAG: DUF1624 domain-containing protein [Oscillospiraceae bacterium]|jgi:uncharacterized membrane protein|nr:DUF1624 domain-containing protein [Oscillospiraceae bacterium]